MDAIAIVTSAELGSMKTYDGEKVALGNKIDIDQHPAKALLEDEGSVFLIAARPQKKLWLVARLYALDRRTKKGWPPHPNNTPIIDITSIAKLLEPLETRRLTERQSELIDYAACYPTKSFEAKIPKWKLEEVEETGESIPVPLLPKVKLPRRMQLLGLIVAAQLEETAGALRDDPKSFLKKKYAFTETVQSIFEGSGDEARLLREELAPWKKAGDVDSAARHAIEDLARAIVAVAQGRAMPKKCAPYAALVDAYVPWMRELLA